MFRLSRLAAAAALAALAQTPPPVSPDALRVHVSYFASGHLKGRQTPSPELDEAAAFIASQFRRAGLQPAAGDSYFQTANLKETTPVTDGLKLVLGAAEVPPARVEIIWNAFPLDVRNAPVVRIAKGELGMLKEMSTAEGLVLLAEEDLRAGRGELVRETARLRPAALVFVTRFEARGYRRSAAQLLAADEDLPPCPILMVSDPDGALLKELPEPVASIHIAAPQVRQSTARNIAGLLCGTDPTLNGTYVVVSAHYDHLGRGQAGPVEVTFPGANDNASGTASLIEVAASLAAAKPARSILFLAFFGEEKGLLGSRYYVRHPLVPLAATVADINLEQMGRTDDSEGPRVSAANLTGFDYSNLGEVFAAAGGPLGVRFYRVEGKSAGYFGKSDNYPFARAGIPSHTVSVSYVFPDAHSPRDGWDKLDYENMARVARAVAAGVLAIANNPAPPAWNPAAPGVEPFRNARQ